MDDAWNNFMITGRVTDYLKYKESHEGSFDTTGRGWENRPDGTEYRSDRDGLKGNADWRL